MDTRQIGPLKLSTNLERWPRSRPARITGYTFDTMDVITVTVEKHGVIGRGEASGVYYRNESPASMGRQIEALRAQIEKGLSRDSLQRMLPPGGARNALDCAMWGLQAKLTSTPAWQLAGLGGPPRPLVTTLTCHADAPETMARQALSYTQAAAIKLKLTGEPADTQRIRAVRDALPDVWLAVDANQGFSQSSLEQLMPILVEANVALIEQPFAIGQEALLDGLQSPIPIAADESVQCLADVAGLVGRFDVVNIKLDKCGGLTEGLTMARRARELGLDPMVGNMGGTSLAMAPAFLLGQLCTVVDLDGPVFLKSDRPVPAGYHSGRITCPEELWA